MWNNDLQTLKKWPWQVENGFSGPRGEIPESYPSWGPQHHRNHILLKGLVRWISQVDSWIVPSGYPGKFPSTKPQKQPSEAGERVDFRLQSQRCFERCAMCIGEGSTWSNLPDEIWTKFHWRPYPFVPVCPGVAVWLLIEKECDCHLRTMRRQWHLMWLRDMRPYLFFWSCWWSIEARKTYQVYTLLVFLGNEWSPTVGRGWISDVERILSSGPHFSYQSYQENPSTNLSRYIVFIYWDMRKPSNSGKLIITILV